MHYYIIEGAFPWKIVSIQWNVDYPNTNYLNSKLTAQLK